MNAQWHSQHRMPKNGSMEQRLQWHLAHATACGCREVPPTILSALRNRGFPCLAYRNLEERRSSRR